MLHEGWQDIIAHGTDSLKGSKHLMGIYFKETGQNILPAIQSLPQYEQTEITHYTVKCVSWY